MTLLKKAPTLVPGCGNRSEDGPQSNLFSVHSTMEDSRWHTWPARRFVSSSGLERHGSHLTFWPIAFKIWNLKGQT